MEDLDACYVPGCDELAAGICQWCFEPVCGTHSIDVNGPRHQYFYLCDNCYTDEHYTILYNRMHQSVRSDQEEKR